MKGRCGLVRRKEVWSGEEKEVWSGEGKEVWSGVGEGGVVW